MIVPSKSKIRAFIINFPPFYWFALNQA